MHVLVVYSYIDGEKVLFGRCVAVIKNYPPTFDEIKKLENEIEKMNGYAMVIIINVMQLS